MEDVTRRLVMVFAVALLTSFSQSNQPGQQGQTKSSDQKKEQPPPKKDPAPTPLFGGRVGARSSQAGKESATLGFNGIDPSGKVNERMLASSPKATDAAQVRNLAAMRPSQVELAAFLREGGLKAR